MKNILIVFTLAFSLTAYAQTLTPQQMAALAAAQGGTYFDKAQLSRNDTFRLRVGAAMYQVATEAFADSLQALTHEYAARVLQNASSDLYLDHFTRAVLLFPITNNSADIEIYAVVKNLWPNIVRAWLIETGRIRMDYSALNPQPPVVEPTEPTEPTEGEGGGR
jgi:hypothetical protein